MSQQYILYEHAAGFALFLTDLEETFTDFADLVSDINTFKQKCHFVVFKPFKRGRDALENINSISESVLHPDLEEFLTDNLPTKKKKYVLGVEDTFLATSIKEKLEMTCNCTDAVKEMIRGIRLHFHDLIPDFGDLRRATKVQLGLAHAYSRCKVKFNVGRVDNMIIQTIALVDQLDKDINSLTMRIREWYSHHFPELIKIVPENTLYIQCVNIIKNRKNMPEDAAEQLENVLNDPVKVNNIIELARSSMGMDVANSDLDNMDYFVENVMAITQRRKALTDYLKSKMLCVAPNLAALIGDFVGARLIAQAGSLINLAKAPASTVQILGAEKALFRALKTRGNTPKYGLLFHSSFIGKASKRDKGRISRYLANKCSVASRIDSFRDFPTNAFGNKMKEQVEERLKFYDETKKSTDKGKHQTPRKNNDVMEEAMEQAEVSQHEIMKHIKREQKKARKRKREELYMSIELDQAMSILADGNVADEVDTSVVKKKKKKRKLNDTEQELSLPNEQDQNMSALTNGSVVDEADTSVTKKKSKKKLNDAARELSFSTELDGVAAESSITEEANTSIKKKKKKLNVTTEELSHSTELDNTAASIEAEEVSASVTKKKKKKKLNISGAELCLSTDLDSMGTLAESSVGDEVNTSVVKKLNDIEQELSLSIKLDESMASMASDTVADEVNLSLTKKKKKKKKKLRDAEQEM